jgi:hypothetical protein
MSSNLIQSIKSFSLITLLSRNTEYHGIDMTNDITIRINIASVDTWDVVGGEMAAAERAGEADTRLKERPV